MTGVRFGVDVSTSAAPGADPIGDARHAERVGYDFVSASDHPGAVHPTFETWTMLTWIAAHTTRITVATRVLGVPFRAPPPIAKAAEALDRLCGGRLILGLGVGASDREIGSLGLPLRSAREKIRALEEAVQIIRGLWREPVLSYPGLIYHTDAARLEPKPARQIPIWLGTFGPRGLAVTGRLADGWIPSLGPAPADQLPAMRAQVFAAAQQGGRDPATLTCALNLEVTLNQRRARNSDPFTGPADKIIEGLLRYVGLGFTAFNLIPRGGNTRTQVERLAAEVLPVVRAATTAASP